MSRILSFVIGFLLGAICGAAAVLLLTPQPGAALRERIRHEAEAILAEGKQAAQQRQRELEAQLERLRTGKA
ncbi:MAG: YtxH domain-containing protein [Anaerolineae bacterium]|nr:YtxH domain-containing protein [Thermoflexales bacterium]MDW8396644.1 YtxH domain-containing protein [Anaerolineae bacterium]